jgi:DNA repair exonuclease SbcCD ATPase subunit
MNNCMSCLFATKKPGGKVSCSEHPEMGKAFKPIEDCSQYTPEASSIRMPISSMDSDECENDQDPTENTNSISKVNTTILTSRTPALIAAEINDIKGQTRKMILYNSIEIGRKLTEAKSLLNHGEWGEWLETSVSYSQSTAENLMRIFDEYGSDQITFLTDNAKSQALGNLSYTQAVVLLKIPEDEREAFVTSHDMDNMSTRELQQAIKDRDQAVADKEKADQDKENAINALNQVKSDALAADERITSLITEKDKLAKDLDAANKKVDEETTKLKNDLEKSKKDLDKKKSDLEKLNSKIKELETKPLDVNPGATPEEIEKIKSDIAAEFEKEKAVISSAKDSAERRVKELEIKVTQQSNAAALRYTVYFESLTKNFSELIKALSDIKATDEETYERYKYATTKLISTMTERI